MKSRGTLSRRKEVWVLGIEIGFLFPSSFFFCMIAPLDFIELDGLASGDPFFVIKDPHRPFFIGEVGFQWDFFQWHRENFRRDPHTLLELGYMKHIVESLEP